MKWMMRVMMFWLLMQLSSAYAIAADGHRVVEIQTNKGNIVVELDAAKAPVSVENFLRYAMASAYDGTIFHRVIPGFMIQGGGYEANFRERSTLPPIKNEAENGLKNLRGTIAMARTGDPHSATSQFFINLKDNAFLDFRSRHSGGWGYAVFGRVVSGMDVVDAIAMVSTRSAGMHNDVPVEPVLIKAVVLKK